MFARAGRRAGRRTPGIGCDPDAEMDVRLADLRVAARADRRRPTSPSATVVAPAATAIEPRCVSVTASPSAVAIVTHLPEPGTVPANVTVPAAGATHGVARAGGDVDAAMLPAAYGCAGSKTNGWSTGPPTGHVHARASRHDEQRDARPRRAANRRIDTTSVVRTRTVVPDVGAALAALSNKITKLSQRAAIEVVCETRPSAARRPRPRRRAAFPPRRARRPPTAASAPSTSGRRAPGADHERDLSLRRLREALRELATRHRARPPRTASSARGRRRPRAPASNAASERSVARQPLRRLERDDRRSATRRAPARAPSSSPALARQEADERVALRRRARSRRAPSRPPTAPGSTVTGTPASSAARTSRAPGIGDAAACPHR